MALSEKMVKVVPESNQLWIIDLASVDFMDSSGLVPLVKGLKAARKSRLSVSYLQRASTCPVDFRTHSTRLRI